MFYKFKYNHEVDIPCQTHTMNYHSIIIKIKLNEGL